MPFTYILRLHDGTIAVDSAERLSINIPGELVGDTGAFGTEASPELLHIEQFGLIQEADMRKRELELWDHRQRMALLAKEFKALRLMVRRIASRYPG